MTPMDDKVIKSRHRPARYCHQQLSRVAVGTLAREMFTPTLQPAFNDTTLWDFERGADGWMHWLNHEPSDRFARIAREVKLYTHKGRLYLRDCHACPLYLFGCKVSDTVAFLGDRWMSNQEIMRVLGTTPDELDRVLALHPKLIVARDGPAPADADPEYLRKLAAVLDSQYEYLETIDHFVRLYRLRPTPDEPVGRSAERFGDRAAPKPAAFPAVLPQSAQTPDRS